MNGLYRRGGVWWARLVVPVRLRAVAGRREFVRSTGAHDFNSGKVIAAAMLAEWRRQLFVMERGRVDDEKLLRLVDGSPGLATDGFISLRRASEMSALEVPDLLREVEAGNLELGCRVSPLSGPGYVVDAYEHLNPAGPEGGYDIPNEPPRGAMIVNMAGQVLRLPDGGGDVASAVLVGALASVDLVALEQRWGMRRHLFVPDQILSVEVDALEVRAVSVEAIRSRRAATISPERMERVRAARSVARQPDVGSAGEWASKRYSEAVEAYCVAPNGLPNNLQSSNEQRQRRRGLLLFPDFMGDLPLGAITSDLLRKFRDGPLKTLPERKNALPKGIWHDSMKATIKALRADGRDWGLMSPDRQHEHMQWILRFFAWLKTSGYLKEDPAAPLIGETGQTKAQRDKESRRKEALRAAQSGAPGDEDEDGRRPFSGDELSRIFGQPQFLTGHGRHALGNQRCYPFNYWLPLLAACLGVRLKEASQLHLSDVRADGAIWYVSINQLTDDKFIKNDTAKRVIPLHPLLIQLGFVRYCEALREAGFVRVFPELTSAQSDAKYAKESGRKMSATLRDLGMPRDGSLVFHCLRHCFNNALIRVPQSVFPHAEEKLRTYMRYKLMGHKMPDDVNIEHYTHVSLPELAILVSAVSYPGLPEIAAFDVDYGVQACLEALTRKKGHRRGKEDLGELGQWAPGTYRPGALMR